LRVVGSGGANRAMEAEIKRLAPRALPGFRPPKPERVDTQTLVYPFDPAFARFLVTYLRTPSRVLWDVGALDAERLEPLYAEVRALIEEERPAWLGAGTRISVAVPDGTDLPASGLQIRGTIKNAIIDGAQAHGLTVELDPEHYDVPLVIRGKKRPIVLSIDLAGRSMHERGWRLEEGGAPLKETLAAQVLMLARWDSRTEVLLDPMSGSGTIPIEGALMALAAPLWTKDRPPAIERIPGFAKKHEPDLPLFADATPQIVANEIHTPLIDIAKRNAARAGVPNRVSFFHGDFRDLTKAKIAERTKFSLERGLIVVNPPYGERLARGKGRRLAGDAPDEVELVALYESLRDFCMSFGRGWRAAFIVANEELERTFKQKPMLKKPMWNGPLRAWLLVYELR
jgi:23S rRNA G2445 N2-methylase RlmL